MKLLFKQDAEFSAQFKEILGFVDADFRYINVKAKLLTATQEFIDLIGDAVYNEIVASYEANTTTQLHKVFLAQSAIALNAYRMLAPNNDLVHSNNGRASRKTDKQVAAFEWMLDRSDKQLERDYYKALDLVLEFLEIEKSTTWLASPKRLRQNQYFVNTTKDFEEYFPIQSRLLLLKLQPGIRKAERDEILSVLGVSKFDTYKTLILAGNGITAPLLPMYKLIQEALVYYAIAWGMSHLSVQLLPEGTLQKYASEQKNTLSSKVPEQLQTQLAEERFLADANRIMKTVQNMLTQENESDLTYVNPQDFIFDFGFDENDNFVDS